jgi:NAD(P)-dependent dehydrogenase (short-subunit alcohol dehydrogenase family)
MRTNGILSGKVAVITGGSRGLGLAIAWEMVRSGAKVMISARTEAAIQAVVEAMRADGLTAAGISCDVNNLDDITRLLDQAISQFGRVDIWVNNAGISSPYGPTLQVPVSDFLAVQQTNIIGTYYGSRVAMRYFVPRGKGKLINILGRGWQGPVPNQNAYAASKAWIRNFTLALAEETKTSGVGVFAYNPGMVLTDLLTHVRVLGGSEPLLKQFPMVIKLLAQTVDKPAQKAAWIASAATDGETGKLYNLNNTLLALWRVIQVLLARIIRADPQLPSVQIESIAGDPIQMD